MNAIPADLRYTATHEWIRLEADGSATVGITDFAQELLGDIVFVDFPKPGRTLAAGESCGAVESVKAASDLYAPVSGRVIEANTALAAAWERINTDPYGAWLFRLQPADAAESGRLLDAAAYADRTRGEAAASGAGQPAGS